MPKTQYCRPSEFNPGVIVFLWHVPCSNTENRINGNRNGIASVLRLPYHKVCTKITNFTYLTCFYSLFISSFPVFRLATSGYIYTSISLWPDVQMSAHDGMSRTTFDRNPWRRHNFLNFRSARTLQFWELYAPPVQRQSENSGIMKR